MNKEFYAGNRKSLYQKLEAGSLVVVFSGHAPIKTNDENYPFFTNRNFLYLTGIEQENIVLMAYVGEGTIEETLYLLPPDAFAERWTGRRIKEEEAEELSGITNYKYVAAFRNDLSRQLFSGNVKKVYLDFDKVYENTPAVEAYRLGNYLKEHVPFVGLGNLHPIMKQLRLIKKPCEIEAMKKAETITKQYSAFGIPVKIPLQPKMPSPTFKTEDPCVIIRILPWFICAEGVGRRRTPTLSLHPEKHPFQKGMQG